MRGDRSTQTKLSEHTAVFKVWNVACCRLFIDNAKVYRNLDFRHSPSVFPAGWNKLLYPLVVTWI